MTESVNQLMTKVFVEQPLALPGSANNQSSINNPNLPQIKESFVKPILAICFFYQKSLVHRGVWFSGGDNTQHMEIATYRLNWPRYQFSEK